MVVCDCALGRRSNPFCGAQRRISSAAAHLQNDRGGNRTHRHEVLDLAAEPVCVPGQSIQAEAVRLELTSGKPAACFRNRVLIQPDDFRFSDNPQHEFRGLESNQRTSGSEPDATTNSSCPGSIKVFHHAERDDYTCAQKNPASCDTGFSSLHEGLSAGIKKTNEAGLARRPQARTTGKVAGIGRMKNEGPTWLLILNGVAWGK